MGMMGKDTNGFSAAVTAKPYNTDGVFHSINIQCYVYLYHIVEVVGQFHDLPRVSKRCVAA
jgi:hypothetical protein